MFAIIHDDYGNIYEAEVVSKGHKTRQEAIDKMRELFDADCKEYGLDDNDINHYINESRYEYGYAFTPRGIEDAAYRIIEV